MPANATILVLGAGAVGLLCAFMAKQARSRIVIIADIDKGRVDFAINNGFAHRGFVVPLKRGQTIDEKLDIAKDTAAQVGNMQDLNGEAIGEVDVVFECTGVESCVQAGIYATKAGGRLMMVGMGNPIQTLPLSAAALREVDLCGVFRYADTYDEGISMISKSQSSMLDLEKLVTHRYHGLDNAQKAFEMAGRTIDDEGRLVLKVVVEFGGGVSQAKT